MIRLAIQKSGRLYEATLALLRAAGLDLPNGGPQLRVTARNFPLTLYLLRHGDIPGLLEREAVDLAVVGQNLLREADSTARELEALGFGHCRLSLAVPAERPYAGIGDLKGARVATSYPRSTAAYLEGRGVRARLQTVSGSVEVAPRLDLADAVCDLVSSGSTLLANGLREVETVLESEAVLAGTAAAVGDVVEELRFRLRAVRDARSMRYVLFNLPDERLATVLADLPGLKSPTVTPLAEPGWSSVQTVIPEAEFWPKLGALKQAGAEGMLVLPVQNLVP